MMSVLHSHRLWLMPLFAVRKFRKIDAKNQRVTFSQSEIRVLFKNSNDKSTFSKVLLPYKVFTQKNAPVCKGLDLE